MSANQPVKIRPRISATEAWRYNGAWASAETFVTQYGAKWVEMDARPGFGILMLDGQPSSSKFAMPDEWIVLTDNGKLIPMSSATFGGLFIVVGEGDGNEQG